MLGIPSTLLRTCSARRILSELGSDFEIRISYRRQRRKQRTYPKDRTGTRDHFSAWVTRLHYSGILPIRSNLNDITLRPCTSVSLLKVRTHHRTNLIPNQVHPLLSLRVAFAELVSAKTILPLCSMVNGDLKDRVEHPQLRRIAAAFVRYANLTIGGGSATIAVLHRELVVKRTWLDESRFGLCYALSRVTPGTNLLAFCTGIGWLVRRLPGAVVALLAASIPSSVLVIIITIFFAQWSHNPVGRVAIGGAMAAAVGITVTTCWTISEPYISAPTGSVHFCLLAWRSP